MRAFAAIALATLPGALLAEPYHSFPDEQGLLWNATEILAEENGDSSIWFEIERGAEPLYAWAEVRCRERDIALIGPDPDKDKVSKTYSASARDMTFDFRTPEESRDVVWAMAATVCVRNGFKFPYVSKR